MRLVAALAWYSEPAEFLQRLLRSLEGRVDSLVAEDGRWDLMDGEALMSSADERLFIAEGLRAITGVLAPFAMDAPWPSQVAKRDALMQQAAYDGDWILVIDGDETLEIVHPGALREALAATDLDVAEVTLRTLNRPWPFAHLAPMTTTTRRIYRAGTRVIGPAHNDYARDGVRLNGDPAVGELAPALDLTGLVTIVHDNRARGVDRERAAQDYRRARRAHGVEVPA